MQLTRFDRWLREKYVYEMHIKTLRPVESLPDGVRFVETPDAPGKRYKHLYIAKSNKAANKLISILKENSQMYTTEIVERDVWYRPFIAPKNKSLTWWLFSTALILISVFFALIYIKGLAQNPEFQKNFQDTIRIFKG